MQIMKCFDTTWLTKSSPASANAALSPHPRLQTSYPPSAHSISPSSAPLPSSLAPGRPSTPPVPSPPPAAKSSIFFGRIKRPPKTWWSAEVEQAVSERRKAFAAAHRSDEDRQASISASRRASSVTAKAKTEA